MDIYIYGLYEKDTSNIRYIGKTKNNLNKRLRQHLNDVLSLSILFLLQRP